MVSVGLILSPVYFNKLLLQESASQDTSDDDKEPGLAVHLNKDISQMLNEDTIRFRVLYQ